MSFPPQESLQKYAEQAVNEHMPELHWRYGYALALALMGAVVFAMLVWFQRKGWFRT